MTFEEFKAALNDLTDAELARLAKVLAEIERQADPNAAEAQADPVEYARLIGDFDFSPRADVTGDDSPVAPISPRRRRCHQRASPADRLLEDDRPPRRPRRTRRFRSRDDDTETESTVRRLRPTLRSDPPLRSRHGVATFAPSDNDVW